MRELTKSGEVVEAVEMPRASLTHLSLEKLISPRLGEVKKRVQFLGALEAFSGLPIQVRLALVAAYRASVKAAAEAANRAAAEAAARATENPDAPTIDPMREKAAAIAAKRKAAREAAVAATPPASVA